jgi:hypothetical protein
MRPYKIITRASRELCHLYTQDYHSEERQGGPRHGDPAFTLELQAGTHTNRDGLCAFTVSKMNASNCLPSDEEATASATDYIGNAYFSPMSGINHRGQGALHGEGGDCSHR